MVDFSKGEDVEAWLRTQPRETAIILAARAAARVAPGVVRDADLRHFAGLTLEVFRMIALARAAAKYPARASGLRDAAAAATDAAYAAAARATAVAADAAARAAVRAAAFASAFADAFAAELAARATAFAADAADAAFADAFAAAAAADARALQIDARLWPRGEEIDRPLRGDGRSLPDLFAELWSRLKADLLSRPNENWHVWTLWYDAWLDGRPVYAQVAPARREQLEFDICLIPEADWNKGPAHVNAIIARMIDEAAAEWPVDEEALPKQTPNAATYGPNARGQMAHLPVTGEHRLSDLPDVRFFYTEARDLAAELHQLGLQFLGEPVHKRATRMCEALPEDAQAAIEWKVWATGNALRQKLSAHDAVAPLNAPHPDLLEKGAAEHLRAFINVFNQLAFADPKLRVRDERRPGPQETRDARAEIRTIAPVATQAASDEAITTPPVGADLRVAAEESRAADEGVVGRLGAEQARDTLRNFEAATLVAVYRTLRAVKRIAQGDGGFITKETFSGAYKALGAGAMGAVGLVLSGNANWLVGWETVQHIASNLQALRVYAPLAFQSSPSVRPLLDYIEATVEIEDRKKGAKPR